MTRRELRAESTKYLNSIPNDELFYRFEITRVAEITGMDFIGLPVYSTCRPNARRVSVSAGKSRIREMARAGAIAEGIEFHTFEYPQGTWCVGKFDPGPLDMPTGKDSLWTPDTELSMDLVHHFNTGQPCWYPSSLIWISQRRREDNHTWFMGSTNGNAVGPTLEDALCQGICELVERDAYVLRQISLDHGVDPPCVDLDKITSGPLAEIRDACERGGAKIYLFLCTVDIEIPVYWAVLADNDNGMGRFAGYGCHLNPIVAAERAMLEAVQSRGVYISGARDDIMRRDFYRNRAGNHKQDIIDLESVVKVAPAPVDAGYDYDVMEELAILANQLGEWSNKLFYKHIDLGDIQCVKCLIPGLEQMKMYDWWRSMRWQKLVDQENAKRALA